MSLIATEASFKSKVSQIGRAALHALFPKDAEYYFIALELVDSQGNTVDYFAWPVLPDQIRETHVEITRVRKTIGGVNVTKNSTFTPRQITINGTFGKRFKILLKSGQVEFAGFGLSMQNGRFNISTPNKLQNNIPQFSSFAKSGYGCVKLLEGMKEKSKALDGNNKPFSLFLYNPILGNNYQVEFNSFTHFQDESRFNMFPGYGLQITAVAPLDTLFTRAANVRSTLKNLSFSNLQKTANTLAIRLRSRI